MSSKHTLHGPAFTALLCLIAVSCGGGNEIRESKSANIPNKPPIIVSQSLKWDPWHEELELHFPYVFSVSATDPDIADKVVEYEWVFSDGKIAITTDPSVEHTFVSPAPESSESGVTVRVRAIDSRGATKLSVIPLTAWVRVRATDSRGATGPYETFAIPLGLETSRFKPTMVSQAQPVSLSIGMDG